MVVDGEASRKGDDIARVKLRKRWTDERSNSDVKTRTLQKPKS